MGAYLAKPNTEKSSENGTNNNISYGVSSMQGWRITMEDAHTCMLDYDDNAVLFAVYDGHGGSEVAQYVAKHLPDMLKSMETFQKGEIKQSLIDAFLEVDTAMISEEGLEELHQLAGSDKDDLDDDEDIGMLEQEAAVPLQELLAKMKEMKKARNDAFEIEDNKFEEHWSTSDKQDCCATEKEGGQTDECSGGQSESKGGKEKVESNGSAKEDVNCQPDSTETENLEEGEKEKVKEEKTAEEEASKLKKEETSSGAGENSCGPSSSVGGVNDDEDSEGEDGDSSEDEDGNNDNDDDDDDDDDEEDDDDDDDSDNDNSELPFQSSDEVGYDSGTTAIVALLCGNHLTVANVGDSRCVLCRNGIALDMSVDHKPEDKQELDRIHKAGGKVTCEGRVNGGLNLSRALGDHSYKLQTELSAHEQQITAVPDVRQTEITEADEFMVVACDGIWNVKGSQEVVDFVSDQLREQRSKNQVDLKYICEKLIDSCLAPDTSGDGSGCDNMTCIIVLFESPQPPSKKRKSEEEQVDGDPVDKGSRTEEF